MSPYLKRKLVRIQEEQEKWRTRIKRKEKRLDEDQRKFNILIGMKFSDLIGGIVAAGLILYLIAKSVFKI